MNINRHNYEEFFLLYVDGELDATQRASVEAFVQQNQDLAEELEMLQQSVLLPENILFDQKESLFRTETGINHSNYETYFFDAVDNELTKKDAEEVEKFVLQNPQLQQDYTLLLKTKLPAETIPYPNKEELYRKEEKRRVVPISWLRMSAAAAIIFLVAATWILQGDGVAPIENAVAVNTTPIDKKVTKETTTQPAVTAPVVTEDVAVVQKEETTKPKSLPVEVQVPEVLVSNQKEKNKAIEVKPYTNPGEVKTQKLLPPTEEMLAAIIRKPSSEPGKVPAEVSVKNSSNDNTIVAVAADPKAIETGAPIARTAVYKELEEDEEGNSIYLGVAEINKNKLKSIFKKASTLFERKDRSNDDDDRTINIANFRIKSK